MHGSGAGERVPLLGREVSSSMTHLLFVFLICLSNLLFSVLIFFLRVLIIGLCLICIICIKQSTF